MADHRFYHINPAGKITPLPSPEEALAARRAPGYLWLDYHNPGREDLAPLIEAFGIHPLSAEDCLDDEQIPKVENFPSSTFVLINSYVYEENHLEVGELDFILGSDFLISVSRQNTLPARLPNRVEEALALEADNLRRGPDFLLYFILDEAVDRKFVAIETLQDEIDRAEEQILEDISLFRPAELMKLRRRLLLLRKSLFHERETLTKICRRDSPFIGEKTVYLFRDIYDHLAKFFEVVEIYREMITSLMEMYLSMINNQMASVANRTNRVMRRLTLITTIFMPLTLLAGIGGMSEWSMITGPENWRWSYPAFILLMVLIGLVSYLLLRQLDRGPVKRGPSPGGAPGGNGGRRPAPGTTRDHHRHDAPGDVAKTRRSARNGAGALPH